MTELNQIKEFGISEKDLRNTPPSVLNLLFDLLNRLQKLEEENTLLRQKVSNLETKLNRNSSNSSRPPSSDNTYKKKSSDKKTGEKEPGKSGGKKGHKGHRQVMLDPTEKRNLQPGPCSCGNSNYLKTTPYHVHQVIELPEIKMEVTHFILHSGKCPCCGKLNKAPIPSESRSGYGPRFSAMIAEMAGTQLCTRRTVQNFCHSVLNVPISLGGIQKIIDRVSVAIEPHYCQIAQESRSVEVNHVDETSWRKKGSLNWLWVMVSSTAAFFMIHPKRSSQAFEDLRQGWEGILVSDGYGVYQKWVGLRQTCLAHLIRDAKGLSEKGNPDIAKFGKWAHAELQRLCHMAHHRPSLGEWNTFNARLTRLISRNDERKDEAGTFARRLTREMDSLWVFLEKEGVDPTNNYAERTLRFAVIWRKVSQGTDSDKGNRWVERILSLRQTCRIQSKRTFPVLVDALRSSFKEEKPDLSWISPPQIQTP